MKTFHLITVTAVACLLGAFIGYKLGHNSIPPIAEKPMPVKAVERPAKAKPGPAKLIGEFISGLKDRDSDALDIVADHFKTLDRGGVEIALAEALKIRGREDRRKALHIGLEHLSKLDPEAAILFLAGGIPNRERYDYANVVFRTIAKKLGGAATFELYKKHLGKLDGQLGISSLFPIFNHWRTEDLGAALSASSQVEDKGRRRQMVMTLCEAASQAEHRPRLLEWARQLEDEDDRLQAFGGIARNWAESENPETVLAWASESQIVGKELDAVERDIASVKMAANPLAAADWLMARTDEESRSEDLEHIIEKWVQNAPNAAGEWLAQQELDAGADKAISFFAWRVAREDPESAHEWAKQIKDVERREEAIQRVMQYWNRSDPVAAKKAREG